MILNSVIVLLNRFFHIENILESGKGCLRQNEHHDSHDDQSRDDDLGEDDLDEFRA